MNTTLMVGTFIVIFALISYSIAIINEQRSHKLNVSIMTFLTVGVILDITATIFMIIGSTNTPFTVHGFIGYSALLAMLIDLLFIWKLKASVGLNAEVPKKLHIYSRFAYIWWVVAFASGGIIASTMK